eukprot:8440391-Karenia_brevis.AAC.1
MSLCQHIGWEFTGEAITCGHRPPIAIDWPSKASFTKHIRYACQQMLWKQIPETMKGTGRLDMAGAEGTLIDPQGT